MLPLEGAEPPDLGDKGPARARVGGEEAGKWKGKRQRRMVRLGARLVEMGARRRGI